MQTDYYKKQLEVGMVYQDFVYEVLAKHGLMTVGYGSKLFQQRLGENKAGIEIKYDSYLATTGNVWIEIAEKSNPARRDYVPSGIQRNCVEYLIGNYDEMYRFATTLLRRMWHSGRYRVIENRMKTSQGFLLPRTDAEKFATQVLRPNCDEQMKVLIRSNEEASREADVLMKALLQQARVDPSQITMFE
jgi:hypothetical protein